MVTLLVSLLLSLPALSIFMYLDYQENDRQFSIAAYSLHLFWFAGPFIRCLM